MKYSKNDNALNSFLKNAYEEAGDRDAEFFESVDDSGVNLSPRLERKIFGGSRGSVKMKRGVLVRTIVAAAFTLAVICSVMILNIASEKDGVWVPVIEKEDGFTTVFSYKEPKSETAVPVFIASCKAPTYLPDGVEEKLMGNYKYELNIWYYKGDELMYQFEQLPLASYSVNLEGEGISIRTEEIRIKKYSATLVSYDWNNTVILLWNDSEYAYSMITEVLTADELIRIASSTDDRADIKAVYFADRNTEKLDNSPEYDGSDIAGGAETSYLDDVIFAPITSFDDLNIVDSGTENSFFEENKGLRYEILDYSVSEALPEGIPAEDVHFRADETESGYKDLIYIYVNMNITAEKSALTEYIVNSMKLSLINADCNFGKGSELRYLSPTERNGRERYKHDFELGESKTLSLLFIVNKSEVEGGYDMYLNLDNEGTGALTDNIFYRLEY